METALLPVVDTFREEPASKRMSHLCGILSRGPCCFLHSKATSTTAELTGFMEATSGLNAEDFQQTLLPNTSELELLQWTLFDRQVYLEY